MERNPVSEALRDRPQIQETGFLRQFSHPHQILERNPVSEALRDRPQIQETGFLRQFSHPHQILERNPVSEALRDRPQIQETGFLRQFLMPNHYHLLVYLKTNRFSNLMQAFTLSYAKAINKRYQRVGSLFQGRFEAIHVGASQFCKKHFFYYSAVPARVLYNSRPGTALYIAFLKKMRYN
ncbi:MULTISPECIES: transposase [unclassified Microcoleus]|uniref:transposase n=1 Tax=unclassified Microcoleus TaxID=2642155 RepID=UPI0025E86EBF|nr:MULTISPECIES: transposase [unclassified Microcoleus]